MANWKAVPFDLGNGVLEAEEAFKHTLVVGGAGTRKTHLLTSIASQLVNERAAWNEIGFTVIGLDLPSYVAKICEENKIPFLHLGRSVGFNPLAGSAEVWRRKPNGRPPYVLVDTGSPYRFDFLALEMGRPHRCGFLFPAQTLRDQKKI
ncbi:hypothetical protein [Kyrpidia spormannii]|uniref:hypothetical protein n=1 Tax=Kyrpidia spormannii TaxID=2055160 RepID=UPI001E5DA19D|nr:hypothetical protein [Kyrpidia spormannii]